MIFAPLALLAYFFGRMVSAARRAEILARAALISEALLSPDLPLPLSDLEPRDPQAAVMCVDPTCTMCAPLRPAGLIVSEVDQ